MTQQRRRDAAATRDALLKAALTRFMRLGYDGTTLRDVAADVGVNLALIKRYFDSKEGLFKAALAASPQVEVPPDRDALAAMLSRQLSADAWPDFDEHPVLLLLRASEDANVDALRRQALTEFSQRMLAATGAAEDDDHMLRAQLMVAFGIGVAVVRNATGLQPLGDATSDELVGPIRDVLDALLGMPNA
ncbi:TetR/AcrR family transcriptional regulator [Actinoplanes sp. NPDC026619]|uniref:TetR/AcrR family transcriptional regulator n=1 Tax=Actinoplanes sp. NPDC026619 TaxID=3155798 RepID=UPI0034095684